MSLLVIKGNNRMSAKLKAVKPLKKKSHFSLFFNRQWIVVEHAHLRFQLKRKTLVVDNNAKKNN